MTTDTQIQEPKKVNGSKFVVVFILVTFLISIVVSYVLYRSFLTRPKIQIQDEKE